MKAIFLNQVSTLNRNVRLSLSAILATTVFTSPVTLAKGKPGGGGGDKDIPVDVLFDDNHTDNDGNPTGVANGITSDGGVYSDSNSIQAFVGRSFGMWLYLQGSGRTLNIDLSQSLGCANSVPVDMVTEEVSGDGSVTMLSSDPDGVSDYCFLDPSSPSPLRPQPPVSITVDAERFELAMGNDLDDLQVGCTVETNGRVRFQDSAGNDWRLFWGPRSMASEMMPNPRSCPIRLTRVNQAVIDGQVVDGNFWFFQTTGEHLATLHRRPSQSAGNYFEYYGQFKVPYSGYVVAQTYNSGLTGNHCEVNIPNKGSGLVPSTVSLAHDPATNLLTATAVDQSDDFSAAPASFTWYADGGLLASATGNTLDLNLHPEANTVTVFATHPDWLAKLPNLLTIAEGEVQGTASFSQGGTGGATISVDNLAWSFPRGGRDIQLVITILDASGSPVSGASVEATLDGPSGPYPISATTDSSGRVSKKVRDAAGGTWSVTISDLSHPDFSWDGAQPDPNWVQKN